MCDYRTLCLVVATTDSLVDSIWYFKVYYYFYICFSLLRYHCFLLYKANSFNYATGAVFSQKSKMNYKWHLVVFFSKFLFSIKCNYKIHDKGILAIIWTLKEWWHILKGILNSVEIWTDYKNLKYFMIAKKLNCKQA